MALEIGFKGHKRKIWIENWTWKRIDKVKEQGGNRGEMGQYLKRGGKRGNCYQMFVLRLSSTN